MNDANGGNVMRLRIESDAAPINEYRIIDGNVEFRRLAPSGQAYPGSASRWRRLDEKEIQLHHALGTVVSKWLRVRLGDEEFVLERAA